MPAWYDTDIYTKVLFLSRGPSLASESTGSDNVIHWLFKSIFSRSIIYPICGVFTCLW